MKKILASCAAVLIATSSIGCGCCGLLKPRTHSVAMPVVSSCGPTCDGCNSCGGGYPAGGTYAPPADYGQPTIAPYVGG